MSSNVNTTTPTTNLVPREFTPKRGFKSLTMKIENEKIPFKPHHQKDLILELLRNGPMSFEDMVKKVEKSDEMKLRLKSRQPVFNCIMYHMKDLKNLKVISVE